MENFPGSLVDLLMRMNRLEGLLKYQEAIIFDLQRDIENLYRRAEGWPIENWVEDEFGEDCTDDDRAG